MRKKISFLDDLCIASPEVQEAYFILSVMRLLPKEEAELMIKYYDAYERPWERYPDHCW